MTIEFHRKINGKYEKCVCCVHIGKISSDELKQITKEVFEAHKAKPKQLELASDY